MLAGGELPATGGDRPQVVVTVPLATLRSGKGAATLDDGTVVSATEARRLACDARIIPAVLGGAGEIPVERAVLVEVRAHAARRRLRIPRL